MMATTQCTEIDTVLDSQGSLLSEKALQHLDQCTQCRTLYTWMSEDSRAAPVPQPLLRQIVHSLETSLRPVKPLPSLRVLIAEFILLFVLLTGGLTAILGTAGIARASLTQAVFMGVLLAAGVCLFSAMLANQMRPGGYRPVPEHIVLTAFGLCLLAAMGALFPWRVVPRFVAHGLPCLLVGICMAVVAAALLWPVARRGAPPPTITTGGTLGATAGLLGVIVLQVKCPHQEALHLLVWHGSVLLIAAGVGVLTGWLLQRSSDSRWPTDK